MTEVLTVFFSLIIARNSILVSVNVLRGTPLLDFLKLALN